MLIAEFTEQERRWIRAAFAPRVNRLACLDEARHADRLELGKHGKICQFTHLHERFPDAEMATLEFSPDGNYYSVKRIAVRPLDSGMWKMVKRFANFRVMKSAESWGFGIIEGFLPAVRTLRAAKREPKNFAMERLSACGTSDRGKSSRRYRFGMHSYLPILRVVRIWHAVGKTQKASYCGISNVVKSVGG